MDEALAGRFPEAAEVLAEAGFLRTADRFTVDGYQAVAAFFGATDRSVKGWARDGMPGGKPGKGQQARLDLAAIAPWLFSRWKREQVLMAGGANSPALEDMRRSHAEDARLDLAERKKDLVTRTAVTAAMEAGVSAFVTALTTLQERLVRMVPASADEVTAACEAAAARVRETLGAWEGKEGQS